MAGLDGDMLLGGFADAPRDTARAFRAVLDAMARPGRIRTLSGATPPDGISPAAAAVLLTLTDRSTPLWMTGASAPLARWIAFHTGAPVGEDRNAPFGLGPLERLLPLTDWLQGSPDYPDRSTTLIAEIPSLDGGTPITLSGPGMDGETSIRPVLPEGFPTEFRRNRARYPLGVDLILTSGDAILALPRTVRMEG